MDCFLRPLKETDISDEYVQWFSDAVVTAFLEVRNLERQDCIDFWQQGIRDKTHMMYAICDSTTRQIIGTAKIGEIDRKSMVSDLVVLIGNRSYWGKGLATQAISQANEIAFSEHGIRKLSGGMYENNIGSIKAYLRAGWVVEAILHGHYILDETVMNRVVVSCFNPEYFPEMPELPTTEYDAYQKKGS